MLAAEVLPDTRLALLTEGALVAAEGEDPDLATAPIAGLLRSAHSEHPGRFALIDVDGSDASEEALGAALGSGDAEPQIALREGVALVARLARAGAEEAEPTVKPIDPATTVLITGGASGLGALVARHLAEEHGARHLLLASRSGEGTAGAKELKAELQELGAEVVIAACDVADRGQLEELLAAIPSEHPLGAVIHSAAVLDDGMLDSLDPERLRRVMRPKVDAAWHLHELTAEIELSQFLLFSSSAGILGNPGQANYAAANVFLDTLAQHRSAHGLPATSLAWGGLAQESALTETLSESDVVRLRRLGFVGMRFEQVLELLDAARAHPESLLAPVAFDAAALRTRAADGTLPAILRGLVRVPARRATQTGSLRQRLAGVPSEKHEAVVLELVRTHTATVLGHASGAEVEPDRAFQELGFDSLAAVELRNRLGAATGLRLSPTLVFDYPSARAVAGHLLVEVGVGDGANGEYGLREAEMTKAISALGAVLSSAPADDRTRERVAARLRSFLADLSVSGLPDAAAPEELESMSHEEMFELLDEEFGGRQLDGG